MTSPASSVPALLARPRRTAHQREERRVRILGMVASGFSYEAIAREEKLSRERVRQIVAKSLESEKGATFPDHTRVQVARLGPALRLAASGVESGKFAAIPHLLRVMERLDKYGTAVQAIETDYAVLHEKLMNKLNSAFDRADREKTEKLAAEAEDAASAPPPDDPASAPPSDEAQPNLEA